MAKSKMRDGLIQRGKGRWTVTLFLGYSDPDPVTGKRRVLQRWVSLGKCTRQQAKAKRDELQVAVRKDEFVAPTKRTVGEWLTTWMDESIRPVRRMNTAATYELAIKHLRPALGGIALQALRPGRLQAYYATKRAAGLSDATLAVHHGVLSGALKSAVRQGLVTRNVAPLVDAKPKAATDREEAKKHCWDASEARTFLKAATEAGPQLAAFFALALDSGARRGELLGLPWSAVDLDAGTVLIDRQLLVSGAEPVFGPTKQGKARTIDLNATTVARLRAHKVQQAELKMKNRVAYADHGLVFAKDWDDIRSGTHSLGQPLSESGLALTMNRIIKAAGVKRIKVHGLRHTCATLLLAAGESVHIVAARLGHSNPTVTLSVYAHALPGHGRQAAATLGNILYA